MYDFCRGFFSINVQHKARGCFNGETSDGVSKWKGDFFFFYLQGHKRIARSRQMNSHVDEIANEIKN